LPIGPRDRADVEVGSHLGHRADQLARRTGERRPCGRPAEERQRQVNILSQIAKGELRRRVATFDDSAAPRL
jgi:hypothetical protein